MCNLEICEKQVEFGPVILNLFQNVPHRCGSNSKLIILSVQLQLE